MECPRCHAIIDVHTRFCSSCGFRVEDILGEAYQAFEDAPVQEPERDDVDDRGNDGQELDDTARMSLDALAARQEAVATAEPEEVVEPASEEMATEEDDHPDGAERPARDEASPHEPADDHEGHDAPEEPTREDQEESDDLVEKQEDVARRRRKAKARRRRRRRAQERQEDDRDAQDLPDGQASDDLVDGNQAFEADDEPVLSERDEADWTAYVYREYDDIDLWGPHFNEEEEAIADAFFDTPVDSSKDFVTEAIPRWRITLDALLHNRRLVAIAIAAVTIVVVLLGALIVTNRSRAELEARLKAEERIALETPVEVDVTIEAAGYDESHASPIPLRVVGTAKNDQTINRVVLVRPSSAHLELLPGEYVVRLEGAAASDDGSLFAGSTDSYTVSVSEGEDGEDTAVVNPDPLRFVLELVDPAAVWDNDIDAMRAWMEAAGVEGAEVYANAVRAKRDAALNQAAEEQAAAEEEAARAVDEELRRIETADVTRSQASNRNFTFELPASWSGKVEVSSLVDASGNPYVSVHLPGNSAAELVRVSWKSGAVAVGGTGGDWHLVKQAVSSDGTHHAEAYAYNWPHIAAQGTAGLYAALSGDELAELVSLSTGGAVSYDYVVSAQAGDTLVEQAEGDFSAQVFQTLVTY